MDEHVREELLRILRDQRDRWWLPYSLWKSLSDEARASLEREHGNAVGVAKGWPGALSGVDAHRAGGAEDACQREEFIEGRSVLALDPLPIAANVNERDSPHALEGDCAQ